MDANASTRSNATDVIVLKEAGGSLARIAPALGFNCFEFLANVDGEAVHVIDAAPDFASGREKPSHHGIPLLFPFPNRIRAGRYVWGGVQYEIPASNASYDGTGNAIHGFCLDRRWRVTAHSDNHAVGEFQLSRDAPDRRAYWPADFLIEVRYALRGPTLRADIRIANPSENVALPWGFGTHPYFKLPLGTKSRPARCLVLVPADEEWELTDCLPTGQRLPVSEHKDLRDGEYYDVLKLDDVFTGLPRGKQPVECVLLDEEAGLQVAQRSDPLFREMVVYTPPGRNAVCIEPYTCVTDAINLETTGIETGWQTLEPGGEIRTWIEITAGQVVA